MQQLPERKSPRAGRYDYTSAGVYFVTVCTQDHEEYFGKVVDGRMVLNQVGKVCEEEIGKLNDRGTVDIHEWVVMPNHVHMLLCMSERLPSVSRRDASLMRPNPPGGINGMIGCGADGLLNRPYVWPSLGSVIKLFKWNITKYTQTHNIPFARQSRYHDHIVRNEKEYNNIIRYIQNNPKKRTEDKMYVKM